MCFYRQIHFNCEHRIQWECLGLCITARDSPLSDLCQVRLQVGEVLSKHNFACGYCPINLITGIDVQPLPNGDKDGSRGGGLHPPIDPQLVNASDGDGKYHSRMVGIDMSQCGGRLLDEGSRGGITRSARYNKAQGTHKYRNIGSRNEGSPNSGSVHNRSVHSQHEYQMMGGAEEHSTTSSYQTPPPPQVRSNHQHRPPSMQSQLESKNCRMSPYPLPPPHAISPQRRKNIKRYEFALRGPQQASLERRRVYTSSLRSPVVTPPLNPRYRESPMDSIIDPTTPTKNTQPTTRGNLLPDSFPKATNYVKLPKEHDVTYLNYSPEYFAEREAGLKSRGVQQLAIIDTLSRVRSSDPPSLNLNESKALYQETLAPATDRYRLDMPYFQARSKVLLKALKDGKDLGDVQFWLRTAEKLKEAEGRVDEPLREMEGWMGAMDENPSPLWNEYPKRGWCGWVAEAEGHLEGGHGYSGTYVDENGDVPV